MNDVDTYVQYANSCPGVFALPLAPRLAQLLSRESVYMRGNRADAHSAMTRYLQSYPNGAYSSDANYYLGLIADERGDKQGAMTHFRKVIDASSPKFLENALIYTSSNEYESGNYRQALTDYSRLANSARNATNRQVAQLGMARTHYKLGGHHEAASAATELLENTGLSPRSRPGSLPSRKILP